MRSLANSVDLDEMTQNMAFYQGLHNICKDNNSKK